MDQTAALPEPLGAAVSFPYPLRRPLLLLVILGAGVLSALSFWRSPSLKRGEWAGWAGRPALVIGRVTGYPIGTSGGDYFPVSVRWVQPAGRGAFRSDDQVRVFRRNPKEYFTWGDEVSLWGPWMPLDPGERGGSSARLFVPEGRSVLLQRVSPLNPLRWAAGLRDRFHASFKKHLPESSNHLLCGVLLGDRPPGLESFAADFRRSGTFHLLVASGSNVGFSLWVWWIFSRWVLWWPRRWTIAGAPFIAFLYAFMAGGNAPVLRAAVMASVGSVGALLGRWDRLEHPLILSAGVLLVWDPACLFQAGFQMSYAATLAIAVVWGVGRSAREEPRERLPRGSRVVRRVGQWARELFITSLAAQIALAPLLLYYFGRFSWVGIGANMVAVPLSGVCLSLGAGLAFLDSVWPAAASLWAVPTRWGAEALAGWAHLCAKMPGAEWHHTINGDQAIALGVGVTLGFIALHFKRRRGPVLAVLSVCVSGVVWGLASSTETPALDISWTGGRSPSVRVRTRSGLTVLEKGEIPRYSQMTDVLRRAQVGESSLESWVVDGAHWKEGETNWEVVRPSGGDGFALRLDSGMHSALLNFGLTARQQAEWIQRGPRPVDLLSWTGAQGGPPKKDLLTLLRPRWIVYQGTRIPISVRQLGAAIYRPRHSVLQWRINDTASGFYPYQPRTLKLQN